jgi:hypothetical protein
MLRKKRKLFTWQEKRIENLSRLIEKLKREIETKILIAK